MKLAIALALCVMVFAAAFVAVVAAPFVAADDPGDCDPLVDPQCDCLSQNPPPTCDDEEDDGSGGGGN